MYGGDIDRILNVINQIKDETGKQIQFLIGLSSNQLEIKAHKHQTDQQGNGPHIHTALEEITFEKEQPALLVSSCINSIIQSGAILEVDRQKLNQLKDQMSSDTCGWNNGYGSPWTEVNNLKEKIDSLSIFANNYPTIQWLGEKFALINLMQIILTFAVDAKHSVITYQSHIQGGYDHAFNNNVKSMTWDKFGSESGKTTGNVPQDFKENVNIPKKDTNTIF